MKFGEERETIGFGGLHNASLQQNFLFTISYKHGMKHVLKKALYRFDARAEDRQGQCTMSQITLSKEGATGRARRIPLSGAHRCLAGDAPLALSALGRCTPSHFEGE